MRRPADTERADPQAAAVASRWLGHRLAWERRFRELRADADGTPQLTPRVRAAAPTRRVA